MKTLIAGLGGGLDIVNASALYFLAKAAGEDVYLGAIKSKCLDEIVGKTKIHPQAALIGPKTRFSRGGRYAEAHVADYLQRNVDERAQVFYFAQKDANGVNVAGLHDALMYTKQRYDFDQMIFVDCGGDSLTFVKEDAVAHAQTTDPFQGGDAVSLEALAAITGTYLAVAAIGLDVDKQRAMDNLRLLDSKDSYVGALHLQTADVCTKIPVKVDITGIRHYCRLVEEIAALATPATPNTDTTQKKFSSLTAPVLYHSICGNYGEQYTAANWAQARAGTVCVEPDYAIMQIVKADGIHKLKKQLNGV
ncbi:MAG TPA: DUF1152 domain-containing protein [Acidobacteriota bacterium]|nr:DUF1152 domain-containing protein [Acidobacteriota bacterium]